MDDSEEIPFQSSLQFILGPSLDSMRGLKRKAARPELMQRRGPEKKLRYQREMIKLDKPLRKPSSLLQDNNLTCFFDNLIAPADGIENSQPSPPDNGSTPGLTPTESSSTGTSEPGTPFWPETASRQSLCIYCGTDTAPTLEIGCICESASIGLEVLGQQTVTASELYHESRPLYMPLLLAHFNENLALASLPVGPGSIASYLRTIALQELDNPFIFHAVLYAASAHLDMLRGNRSVTSVWHETALIQLVQPRLNDPQAAFDDLTIAAMVALASFTPFSLDLRSSEAHIRALLMILEARGMATIGMESVLRILVQLSSLAFAVIFDTDLMVELEPSLSSPPTGLLSTIVKQAATATTKDDTICHVPARTTMIQDIHNAIILLELAKTSTNMKETVQRIIRKGRLQAQTKLGVDHTSTMDAEDHINRSCWLAAVIFWHTLDGKSPGSEPSQEDLDCLLLSLKNSVAAVDLTTWLCLAPLEFTWVCLTGAAVARNMALRAWFCFQHSHRFLMVGDCELLRDSWCYFHWLRMVSRDV